MMTRSQRNLWLAAVVLLSVVITVIGLGDMIIQPWNVIPNMGGDGAKNNLTYLYHSAYGKGCWFEGMNYPYGEHIVFTDGIPLLSVFFTAIGNVSFDTALTVLWWTLALSYVLSAVYVYQTVLRFTNAPWFAMVVGVCITVLTPQILRINGHYALSFPCIIPMFFYWTYMHHTVGHWRYSVYLFLVGVVSAFLHPYFAGMLLVWAVFYAVGCVIFTSGSLLRRGLRPAGVVAAAAAVSAAVMMTIKLTDPVKDRPVMPHDPLESYTNVREVLTSLFSPIWKGAVESKIVDTASDGGEGFSYIGLVPILVLLVGGILFLYRMVARKSIAVRDGRYTVWLFVAVAALVFSSGIPFIWDLQWLKEYLPGFRQFRALGRFAWIFYYVITVIAAAVLYGWFAQLVERGKKRIAYTLVVIALVIWGIEVKGYMEATRKMAADACYYHDVIMQTREQNWISFFEEHKLKKEDFQAVLLLRYFHVGTEKIWIGDPGWLITLGSRVALQLHLPIIDVMMSRSSWGQAQKQVKLVGGPYADKPTLQELKDNRPFLLMKFDEDSLSHDEAYLLEASEYIGAFSQCKIFACYPDRITDNDILHREEINEILPYLESGDTCIGEQSSYSVLHFDEMNSKERFCGKGAAQCIKGSDSIVAMLPLYTTELSIYEFSCWFLLEKENYFSPTIKLDMLDSTGKEIASDFAITKQSTDSYGMWFRTSKYFYMPAGTRQVRCTLMNVPAPSYKAMDEMLLRPAESVVITKTAEGSILVNGHVLKMAK